MLNDSETFGAMAEGIELVSSLLPRYAMIEDRYLHDASALKGDLEESLVRLYAAVLVYLSRARRYYTMNTTSKSKLAL